MKITSISVQARNSDRVNVSVEGKYRFSLDVYQVGELGIKIGNDYSEAELSELENESQFGKLYARTLEYTMIRPHSGREIRDYLWRKTRAQKVKSRTTGEVKDRPGVSPELTDRVFARLLDRGYINDENFARYWVENRQQTKGISRRKLQAELQSKGVPSGAIEQALGETNRDEADEIRKVINKKANRYPDEQKLIAYLARQGFSYELIKQALQEDD